MSARKPRFHYDVSMSRPHRHLYEVSFTACGPFGDAVDVQLPVWSPGSYMVREYARNVQDVAVTSLEGRALRWSKTTKNTWRILDASQGFRFTFRLFANELSVQAPHLDETHAFLHPPAMCPYVDGFATHACEISVHPEPGWRVATGLKPVRGVANTFRAADYDELADTPIECGALTETSFVAGGRKHRIVISGDGELDLEGLKRDTKRIVDEELRFWGGGPPYDTYTFICHVYPGARGGLEHRNSTVLGIDSFAFNPRSKYVDSVLSLIAHEYFHTWNVKRIRPEALGPFDYSTENYTRLLWVFEGITSYYDTLLVRRAGLLDTTGYLKHVARNIAKLNDTPGRLRQSLADASFDTWIKFYRQNEHSPNSIVSYYLKGELVALLLDLYMRDRTDGRVSLDDVMRALWRNYKADGAGIDEDGFERIAADVSGLDLRPFFRRAVHSAAELDFRSALEPFGLVLRTKTKGVEGENGDERTPWLGVETESRAGLAAIKTVHDDSPADRGGLSAGDVLLAIDGYRIGADTLKARLKQFKPGRSVDVTYFRRDRLRSSVVTIERRYETECVIEGAARASLRAKRLRDAWLGGPLDARPSRKPGRKR